MASNFAEAGIEFIVKAVEADQADNWTEAVDLYRQGIQRLLLAIKYEKIEQRKKVIQDKVAHYLDRCEYLQGLIKDGVTPNSKKKVVKPGADDDDDKDEGSKLKGALASVIVSEKPNVRWEDVAGLEQAKALLKEAVVLPVRFPELFQGERRPWAGILLYGPPGTGKSYLAKAVATESGSSCFLSVSSSDLVSKFQGESERLVKSLFEIAREKKPAVIFIDEIDSLCSKREGGAQNESAGRIKTEFLVQMQGVGKDMSGVLVLGATNVPWQLDSAIRRRFEKRVYIPLPDVAARARLFELGVGKTPHTLGPKHWRRLAKKTDGFSGADINVLVRDAIMEPVRTCQVATHFRKVPDPTRKFDCLYEPCSPGDKPNVKMTLYDVPKNQLLPPIVEYKHFKTALSRAKASVGQEDLAELEDWTRQYGLKG